MAKHKDVVKFQDIAILTHKLMFPLECQNELTFNLPSKQLAVINVSKLPGKVMCVLKKPEVLRSAVT